MTIALRATDLLYFPVPKNACTSVKLAIDAHNFPAVEGIFPRRVPLGRTLARRLVRKPAPMVYTVHSLFPTIRYRPWFRWVFAGRRWFCVVRDPVARFVSAYRNRVLHSRDVAHHPSAERLAEEGLPAEPDLDTFVAHFARYAELNAWVDHHFAPAVRYLGDNAARYDRIFGLRDLHRLEDYAAEAGAPLRLGRENSLGPKVSPADLSSAQIAKLEGIYAEDYRVYGRYF